jgi:hypothetical protein
MFTAIRPLMLSALVGLAPMTLFPVAAQADGIYLNLGGQPDTRFGVYGGDRQDIRDWHRHREGRHWRRGFCSPERALDKAERMGLRHPRIVKLNRRVVRVAGRKYNGRVTVTFGNERGCPIAYRR